MHGSILVVTIPPWDNAETLIPGVGNILVPRPKLGRSSRAWAWGRGWGGNC